MSYTFRVGWGLKPSTKKMWKKLSLCLLNNMKHDFKMIL